MMSAGNHKGKKTKIMVYGKMPIMDKPQKGVNLGGWLLMEGYMLHGRNIAEHIFKKEFQKIYGRKELARFEELFRDNFINEDDFIAVAGMGAKIIRLPFNHRLLEKKPFIYDEGGFACLDKALSRAQRHGLKVILDLHAACGSQNCDWHADSDGRVLIWGNKRYQERTYALWQVIAGRYKNHPAIYAYDVLNEPVLGEESTDILKNFYQKIIKHIRGVDKKTLIFLEGSRWAQQIEFLPDLLGAHIGVSIHAYMPLSYTCHYQPLYKYPGRIEDRDWDKRQIYKYMEPYYRFSCKHKTKMFVGEFGINWRGGNYGELKWLDDLLTILDNFSFDYTYWTYKAIAGHIYPDGIYQYLPNSQFVCRQGPVYGWETYLKYWKDEKDSIADFWQSKNYTPNRPVIELLRRHFNNEA